MQTKTWKLDLRNFIIIPESQSYNRLFFMIKRKGQKDKKRIEIKESKSRKLDLRD